MRALVQLSSIELTTSHADGFAAIGAMFVGSKVSRMGKSKTLKGAKGSKEL